MLNNYIIYHVYCIAEIVNKVVINLIKYYLHSNAVAIAIVT